MTADAIPPPDTTPDDALLRGDFAAALRGYVGQLARTPGAESELAFNLTLARGRHRRARLPAAPRVAVCGWEMGHNAAGRVRTLADLHAGFGPVTMIGALFPKWSGQLWAPLGQSPHPCHLLKIEDEAEFPWRARDFVLAHPFDIVHLSKPRMPNILFGLMYRLFWDAQVILDIDDEELGAVQADSPLDPPQLPRRPDGLPDWSGLTGKTWTRIAVGLAPMFAQRTVSNPALQARYGGAILPHARSDAGFAASPARRAASRAALDLPQDATVVLFFGTARRHKGLLETARALQALGRPGVSLAVVGDIADAGLRTELEALRGPDLDLHLRPVQPYERAADVVAAGDICVLLQNAESLLAQHQLPAKLVDALAGGLAVLATPTPALADLVEAGAILPTTPADLAADLGRCLDDPALLARLRRRGHEVFAERLSLDAQAPVMASLREPAGPQPAGQLLPAGLDGLFDMLGRFAGLSPASAPPLPPAAQAPAPVPTPAKGSKDPARKPALPAAPTPEAPAETRATASGPLDALRRIGSDFPGLAVLIPVYNALPEVRACLDSVLRHTPGDVRVIVIDDASPDPGIAPLLDSHAAQLPIEVYRNSRNLGFTRTINRAIALAGARDVIFLNSDTQVTAGWTRRLTLAAYSGPDVGTVTPVSNNAGAFSVPRQGENAVPAAGLEAGASALNRLSARLYPEAPTGNGFCLYVRRACLDAVGTLDAAAFPRGYGEENDFCMRAGQAGWRHLIDDATYVHHVRTASFGAAKPELIAAGRAVIDQRYPDYTARARAFVKGDGLAAVCQQAARIFDAIDPELDGTAPRVLFVLPRLGEHGGTPQTNRDLMRAIAPSVQPFLLVSDGQVLTLRVLRGEDLVVLETETLPAPIAPFPHRSEAYDACVLDWCIRYGIELVHYRHLAFHSHGAPGLFRRLGIRRILSLHDFYMVCPTVKLIDNTERFCAGLCTPSDGSCTYDLWKGDGLPDLKHAAIMDWTAMSSAVMSEFDALVTTSDRARDLILARLPATRRLPFHVIPHGRDFPRFLPPAQEPFRGGKLRILVPGNVNLAKGGMLIRQIAARMQDEVEFHLLGKIGHSVGKVPGLVKHGAYERDTFVDRVAAIEGGVHVGAILSIWPETYCHTLTELWAAGLPVVGVDLGAVGERIAETGAGWLVPEPDVEAAIGVFRQILENPDALLQRAEAVGRWQATLGSERSTDWMAKRYLDIYRGLSG